MGDCFNSADLQGQEVLDLTPVPCGDDHDMEVFHKLDLPEGDFPGEDRVLEDANEACTAAFEGFVGVSFAESELEIMYLTPVEEGWSSASDREVICLLQSATPVDRTLQDSRT